MENGIKEVSAEEVRAIVDRYVAGQSRPEDQGPFIAQDGETWIAVDNTSGDCWVEEFKTKAEALAYAKGEFDVV